MLLIRNGWFLGFLLWVGFSGLPWAWGAQDLFQEAFIPLQTQSAIPPCLGNGQTLPINNQQVLTWKQSTANQFLARAHVRGPITRLYPDHSGHSHFEIQLAPGTTNSLEIVYNLSFGAIPTLQPGMMVEACGDYITSIAQSGPYPPSPDGAILHWVHKNPSGQGHDSGYLVINGILYGQGNGNGAFRASN